MPLPFSFSGGRYDHSHHREFLWLLALRDTACLLARDPDAYAFEWSFLLNRNRREFNGGCQCGSFQTGQVEEAENLRADFGPRLSDLDPAMG
jgi:hypothetical protein